MLPNGHNHFIPTERIRVGSMRWSQVYGGSLSLAGTTIQDDLVLKVIDPAFFPIPPNDPFPPDAPLYPEYPSTPMPFSENSYRYTDDLMAWSEAHAYSKLSPLQGSLIPRMVDIFMLKSPRSKQDKIGIVMSRIHGRNIFDVCRELGSEIDGETGWYPIALQLLRGLSEIHRQGIVNIDISERNIFVTDDKESGRPTVKFFDFGFSRPNHFDTPEEMEKHGVEKAICFDIKHLYYFLSDMCGGAWGRPQYLEAHGLSLDCVGRMCRFMEWAQREYPNDPWVTPTWKGYFKSWLGPED
ncbi:hypothetical protein BDN70DRAFT_879377 [Pholiota conissans]|uniref:Protein kinase domain-containing protein n=1 Tax=Pholiota conissans TaxID=109636 RepID=A0A9P6D008_9AGAR|nr:hypothetical protein BDN70DRAFT_879377 [Pholiota conissans]